MSMFFSIDIPIRLFTFLWPRQPSRQSGAQDRCVESSPEQVSFEVGAGLAEMVLRLSHGHMGEESALLPIGHVTKKW